MDPKEFEIFVPGRLCLFGEHSDWAGGHRRQNSEIQEGYAIVAPTSQGNYALIQAIPQKQIFIRSSALKLEAALPLDSRELEEIARGGGPLSYVAGVAHEITSSYNGFEHGIRIDNHKSDLPLKKGLSSSASISVLTAKAFDKVYGLGFTNRRIMELAYLGETATPSRCGRLDQLCAYDSPTLATFDGDRMKVEELPVGKTLHLVLVDLHAGKDTRKILTALNEGFPFPRNDQERRKHEYLGAINRGIVEEAKKAIMLGDSKKAGELMTLAQEKFDEYLAPFCPEQLGESGSPKLHRLLRHPSVVPFVYGGKGVGSQGDGMAQFIARDGESQKSLVEFLNSDTNLDVEAISFMIRTTLSS